MTSDSSQDQLTSLLEKQLRDGFPKLRFYKRLEDLYTEYYTGSRLGIALVWCGVAIVVYNIMIIPDATMLADRYNEMVVSRLGVFTSVGLICMYLMYTRPNAFIYEASSLVLLTLAVALPMTVMIFSESPHRFAYQSGSVVTMMFYVIVLRTRFRTMIAGLILMCTIQLVTTRYSGAFDDTTYMSIATFYIPILAFMAISAYFQEHSERMNFLNQLLSKSLHEKLEKQSKVDTLTLLGNRRSLSATQEDLWSSLERPTMVFIFMIDIDKFKQFNDSRGHVEGDACIAAVAQTISGTAEKRGGRTFRYGGEEILVMLPGIDLYDAFAAADEICAAVRKRAIPHPALGRGRIVSVSVGVAGGLAPETTFDQLLREADQALYAAKCNGRDQVWPTLAMKTGKLDSPAALPQKAIKSAG